MSLIRFVMNHPEIVGNIGKISAAPLDEIARFWKVYTTTKHRLLDPTAERLENFWWRIWGSQKRELKSAIIAELFAEISTGQTSIPLRGPGNRDERIPSLDKNICLEPKAPSPPTSRLSPTFSSTTPHSILKNMNILGNSARKAPRKVRFDLPEDPDVVCKIESQT